MEPSQSHSGSETILVTDDEPVALDFCTLALRRAGYHVLSATSGEQALGYFQSGRSQIDLALIDVVMPRMSGIELVKRIEELNLNTRIVLMSGYSPDEVKRLLGSDASQYRSMWKPFEAGTLAKMIRNVLDNLPVGKSFGKAT